MPAPRAEELERCPTCGTWTNAESINRQSIDIKSGAAMVMLSALAKYQMLERLHQDQFMHLMSTNEIGDHIRLSQWWEAIGIDKQTKLIELANGLSEEQNLVVMSQRF